MSGLDEVYVSWESTVYPDGGMCVCSCLGPTVERRPPHLEAACVGSKPVLTCLVVLPAQV